MDKKVTIFWICVTFIIYIVVAVQECGEEYLTLDITDTCNNSTCSGECRDESTCCLEKCFTGNRPSNEELYGCEADPGVQGTCSNFAIQTDCLANKLNKTFDSCWKHTVYYISSHPEVSGISGFNPVNCPCEYGHTRIEGECRIPQCLNSSYCQLKEDQFRNTFVCCLDNDIFPSADDCGNHEKLDTSMEKYANITTLQDCQKICQKGICRMPDSNRLPACCIMAHKIVKQVDDSSIHGSVIAVIVTLIVVLLIAGAFIGYYIFRTRKHDTNRKIDSHTGSIEVTGEDEMIGGEQAWSNIATVSDISSQVNSFLAEQGIAHHRDEFDQVSSPEFDRTEQTIETLRTGSIMY